MPYRLAPAAAPPRSDADCTKACRDQPECGRLRSEGNLRTGVRRDRRNHQQNHCLCNALHRSSLHREKWEAVSDNGVSHYSRQEDGTKTCSTLL